MEREAAKGTREAEASTQLQALFRGSRGGGEADGRRRLYGMWHRLLFKVQCEGAGASLILAAQTYKVDRTAREEKAASKVQAVARGRIGRRACILRRDAVLKRLSVVNGFEALVRGMSTAHHLADLLVAATGYVLEDLSVKPSYYTLYTPFIHLRYHMYTYVHPLYMYIHHIYT